MVFLALLALLTLAALALEAALVLLAMIGGSLLLDEEDSEELLGYLFAFFLSTFFGFSTTMTGSFFFFSASFLALFLSMLTLRDGGSEELELDAYFFDFDF